jgi:beta-N-acetylhexosaminidase
MNKSLIFDSDIFVWLNRLLLFILLASLVITSLPGGAAALSDTDPQKIVFQDHINYFNINTCSSTPTAATTTTTSATLTPQQQIAGTFMVGFDASTPQSTIESVVQKYKIGGIFILGTSNAAAAGFNKSFFQQLDTDAGHTLVTASDEEGIIQRYQYPFNFPSAKDMGSMSDSEVQGIGMKVAQTLTSNGINTDLAPVLDVATNNSDTDAGTPGRAFSDDPNVVADKAGAFAAGLQAGGINPVYKHFPGLGSSTGDTDTGPVTSPPLSQLEKTDLVPYSTLSNQYGAAVMMDNAHVPGLTEPGNVASESPAAVNLLRNQYKFSGLIMTDDLTATGVPDSVPTAITKALQAGVNMPLFTYQGDSIIDSAISSVQSAGVSVQASLQKIANFASSSSTNTTNSTPINPQCCPPNGSTTLVGSTNGEQTWNFLIGKGLTNLEAAGIMGNLQGESNFSPTAVNGGVYGIAQWGGPRLSALQAMPNYTSLATQLNFLWQELNSDYKSNTLTPLMGAANLSDATSIVLENYEAPCTGAAQCAPYLATRLGYATTWYNEAGGGAGSQAAATAGSTSGSCSTTTTTTPSSTYSNPFHDMTNVETSRIDEGVDYYAAAGTTVPVYAIGSGTVTEIATPSKGNSEWWADYGGYSIVYQLTGGPAKGDYVYVAEWCPVNSSLTVGSPVSSSIVVCSMTPQSIETGWALPPGDKDEPAAGPVYIEGYETAYGVNFNQLLTSLGAPSGHLDTSDDPSGKVLGNLASGWPSWN